MDKELIKQAYHLGYLAAQNDMAEKQAAPSLSFLGKIPAGLSRYWQLLRGGNRALTGGYHKLMSRQLRNVGTYPISPNMGWKKSMGIKWNNFRKAMNMRQAARNGTLATPGFSARKPGGRFASRSDVANELKKVDRARGWTVGGLTGLAGTGVGLGMMNRSGNNPDYPDFSGADLERFANRNQGTGYAANPYAGLALHDYR